MLSLLNYLSVYNAHGVYSVLLSQVTLSATTRRSMRVDQCCLARKETSILDSFSGGLLLDRRRRVWQLSQLWFVSLVLFNYKVFDWREFSSTDVHLLIHILF